MSRHSGQTLAVVFCVLQLITSSKADAQSRSQQPSTFSEQTLHDRFDQNADGVLDRNERGKLREAFGSIDVPMLPDQLAGYENIELPMNAATKWQASDSTPVDNPITDAGATLGRVLFYDRQMSANNTIACASCHLQQKSFSDPRRVSIGFEGGKTGRNAMSLVNLRFSNVNDGQPGFFWDERAATLEDQVLMPIQDDIEMGMTLDQLQQRLQRLPYYPALFHQAFGSPKVTSERVASAVAQFMRAMTSFDSKFDRGVELARGDLSIPFANFSDLENHGKSLFIDGVDGVGEIGCAHCHIPPTFSMPTSFNNGLELQYKDKGLGARNVPSNDPFTPSNDGKFKASSLRNIELTAPYMHDGRFATLQQVVDHYSDGVHRHVNVGLAFNESESDVQKPTSGFRLNDGEKQALIAFLKTLTNTTLTTDPRFSDPFVRQ